MGYIYLIAKGGTTPPLHRTEGLIQMATITISELAPLLDTDARTARKFLRTITPADAHPGKGSRWAIEKRDIRSLASKFKKFTAAEDEARKARNEAKALATPTAPETDIEDEALDSLDSLEPTDADILDMTDIED